MVYLAKKQMTGKTLDKLWHFSVNCNKSNVSANRLYQAVHMVHNTLDLHKTLWHLRNDRTTAEKENRTFPLNKNQMVMETEFYIPFAQKDTQSN